MSGKDNGVWDTEATPAGPKRQPGPPPKDTPRYARHDIGKSLLTDIRTTIGRAMSAETVYTKASAFIEHYLPPVSESDLKTAVEGLKKSGTLTSPIPTDPERYAFKAFVRKPSDRPKDAYEDEAKTYQHLIDIGVEIQGILKTDETFRLEGCSFKNMQSQAHGVNIKTDACLTDIKRNSPNKIYAHRTLVPFQFKLSKADGKQNCTQLLTDVAAIMYDDVRRNFIYGITVEDDRVSLWYFSRSHSAKAISFSLTLEPELMIKTFIALLRASREQLGVDPNIEIKHGGESFKYRVPGAGPDQPQRWFETTASLDDMRSAGIAGWTTRVWKVKEVDSKGQPVANATPKVLKDVRIGEKAKTEKDIQDDLFEAIEKFALGKDGKPWYEHPCLASLKREDRDALGRLLEDAKYEDYFLRIKASCEGLPNKEVVSGAWVDKDIFAKPLREAHAVGSGYYSGVSCPQRKSGTHQETVPGTGLSERFCPVSEFGHANREFAPKRRCFFVYDDVCTRLQDVGTLGEALGVISHAHSALLLMFCAGWIHRDISVGNILALKLANGKWQGKLSDLEYAKPFPSPPGHKASSDPKTGTPFFMATELQLGIPYFQPKRPIRDIDSAASGLRKQSMTTAQGNRVDIRVSVIHTPQHDLESLWWVVFYLATLWIGHEPSTMACRDIFQGRIIKDQKALRHRTFENPEYPQQIEDSFHRDLKETLFPILRLIADNFGGYATGRSSLQELNTFEAHSEACALLYHVFRMTRDEANTKGMALPLTPPFVENEAIKGDEKARRKLGRNEPRSERHQEEVEGTHRTAGGSAGQKRSRGEMIIEDDTEGIPPLTTRLMTTTISESQRAAETDLAPPAAKRPRPSPPPS